MLRSDRTLEREVTDELAGDDACKLARIVVSCRNGIVTLSGRITDPSLRAAALRAAKRVFGVEGIEPRWESGPTSALGMELAGHNPEAG